MHIRRLPEKHFPEENGSTLTVSHSPTVLLQEHRYIAEMDKSEGPIYHIHLLVYVKISHWECISYDNINTSGNDFIFLTRGYQEVGNIFHSFPGAPHLHFASN